MKILTVDASFCLVLASYCFLTVVPDGSVCATCVVSLGLKGTLVLYFPGGSACAEHEPCVAVSGRRGDDVLLRAFLSCQGLSSTSWSGYSASSTIYSVRPYVYIDYICI